MARFIRNYEVLRELGAGHFGAVYLAVGETPGRGMAPGKRRLVAIKKLKDAADRESVELLLQEFALLEQVKHRSVVRVFDYLRDENAVVMEYIHGRSLRQVLDELSRAKEQVFTESAIEIGCEVADALYQAYTTPGDNGEPLRLVHRDLKPDNIMLTPGGEVKILDFGLARVDNADFAKDNPEKIKGTPLYMAPEQARGESIDHRTDIFALGLILYELLQRRPAYQPAVGSRDPVGETLRAIASADLQEQCRGLESRLPALGPIITRSLQARPVDRYQNGQDLLVDLRRQLYRDRGAYLAEFCEFFFGGLCDIGEAPVAPNGGGARSAPSGRTSIEERLRASMSRDQLAAQVPSAPSAPSRPPAVAAGVASVASSSAPAKAVAPLPPPPSGAAMSSNSSSKPPPRPPVGGAASRATPFAPGGAAGGPGQPTRPVGQRSPTESGMLEMVPLSTNKDEKDAAADPSATAFFAIPAPKAERAKPVAPPAGGGGFGGPPQGGYGGPPQGGGYGGPPPGPPPARPPYGAPSGVGGSPTGGGYAPAGPMVQGPVASYGGNAPATPFQVQGGSAPAADSTTRVQSNRIYAILFALFLLAGVAVVAAVWLRPSGDPEPAVAAAEAAPTGDITGNEKPKKRAVDTAAPPVAAAAPAPVAKSTRKSSSTTSSSSAAAAPAAPAVSSGTVKVRMADASQATAIEIVCPSGFRNRAALGGGSATFSGVPGGDKCTIYFKGGAPAQFGPVSGGSSLDCSIIGTTAVCK